MNRLLRIARTVHKYIGLLLVLYLAWMAASGIGLNHPEWSLGWEMPGWLTPEQYRHADWNRGTLKTALEFEDGSRLLGGSRGLFHQPAGSENCVPWMGGDFPQQLRLQGVNDLLRADGRVWVATDNGLLVADAGRGAAPALADWQREDLPAAAESVKALFLEGDQLLALGATHLFAHTLADGNWSILELPRSAVHETVSLIHWVFHLHDGRVWGFGGRLLIDLAALALIFLCFGALWTWSFPKAARRFKKRFSMARSRRTYRWLLKYHLKIGIWFLPPLILLGATGFFMRPPTLLLIADREVPRWAYPGPLPDNPWEGAIRDGLIDHATDRLWLAADGLWSAPLLRDTNGRVSAVGAFAADSLAAPIFVMGTTAFQEASPGRFLVGSYSGIFLTSPGDSVAWDLGTGAVAEEISSMRPAETMAAGVVCLGDTWIMSDHKQAPIRLNFPEGTATFDDMPAAVMLPAPPAQLGQAGLSFWNWCFELHNGRIFKDWIGPFHLLVTPLGALLFLLLSLTGLVDWLRRRARRRASERGARLLAYSRKAA